MEHFYENIPGWFNFEVVYREAVERVEDGAHFVEVGAWLGKSTAFMAVEIINSGKAIRFDVVDTWLGVPGGEETYNVAKPFYEFSRNMIPVRNIVNSYRGTSVEVAAMYADDSLDFVFIDADHSYEAVKADIKAWYWKIKDGGVLAGHDYDHEGVRQAVNEFFDDDTIHIIGTSWLIYV